MSYGSSLLTKCLPIGRCLSAYTSRAVRLVLNPSSNRRDCCLILRENEMIINKMIDSPNSIPVVRVNILYKA